MQNLNETYDRLNDEQKSAVLAAGNTVVMAGPGSGKTATLVVKIGYLLAEKITPPAGLACLTYNNDAVREFRMRLASLGIFSRRSLFLGTVHSFCLNCIVRPYAGLIDKRFTAGVNVAGPKVADQLFTEAATQYIPENQVRWLATTITRYRRARACDEDVSGFGDNDPHIAKAYEDNLLKNGVIDFEGIIIVALHLIEQHAWIRQLVAARFPWLIVDEYQDLGGPLHGIVTRIVDLAGVNVFAVGDPDQTIYDFTGANPKYLDELAARRDFQSIRLKFNYRSGRRIIDASQAALAPIEPRGYAPDPKRKEQGEIIFLEANGYYADHAAKVSEAVKASLAGGTKPEEIAIFYRGIGPLVEAIREELDRQSIDHIWEKDGRFPSSSFIIWLQRVAAWSLSPAEDREHTFSELFHEFHLLLQAAGRVDGVEHSLDFRILLFRFMIQPVTERTTLHDWLAGAESSIGFKSLLIATDEYAHDLEFYEELTELVGVNGSRSNAHLHEFSASGKVRGKVILTTFHASKGRQFDVVVIPGCAEGLLPAWNWNGKIRRYEPPAARPLAEARRLFYVGLSRARHVVQLVHSESWQDKYGNLRKNGTSRFVEEIRAKLDQRTS